MSVWAISSGKVKTVYKPVKASTVITQYDLVCLVAGFVVTATTTAAAADTCILGVYQGATRTSGQADTPLVPVLVPADEFTVWVGPIDTGTPSATADLGKAWDISSTNGVTFSTTSNNAVTFVGYISATSGLFVLRTNTSPA
jgi:hypothetical protein